MRSGTSWKKKQLRLVKTEHEVVGRHLSVSKACTDVHLNPSVEALNEKNRPEFGLRRNGTKEKSRNTITGLRTERPEIPKENLSAETSPT